MLRVNSPLGALPAWAENRYPGWEARARHAQLHQIHSGPRFGRAPRYSDRTGSATMRLTMTWVVCTLHAETRLLRSSEERAGYERSNR